MRSLSLRAFVVLTVLVAAGCASHQERSTGLSPAQWRHWSVKVAGSGAALATLDALDADADLSAAIATAAPTVVGKLLYMPVGLGEDPARRWPSAGFVVKDIAGELCVQSAPLWVRIALGGHDRDRVLRGALAVGGYGLAVFACARTLEVR